MTSIWSLDPTERPSFEEIKVALNSLEWCKEQMQFISQKCEYLQLEEIDLANDMP